MRRNDLTDKVRRPTRDDVARHAKVSGWTVSNVLNGKEDASITPETRERVRAAAQSLGYRPNSVARSLAMGKTCSIGFWMCFNYSQYRAHVLHYMQQLVRDAGFELVLRDIEDEMARDPGFTRTFQTPVDGIIAFDTPTAGAAFFQANPTFPLPFVSMGAYWARGRDIVGVDLYAGAYDAIRHLIDTGRRRILYLLPAKDAAWDSEARARAYLTVLKDERLTPDCLWAGDISMSAARQAVRDYILAGGNADAIFCHNDELAFGAHRALSELGIAVGEDIALIGCDGIIESEFLSPALTTIRQPVERMCQCAWEALKARLNDPNAPVTEQFLKPELVIRASSYTNDTNRDGCVAITEKVTASDFALLPGECWWGGLIQDGTEMPFGSRPYEADLRHSLKQNQAVPLLVSNKGRFLWSEQGFRFSVDTEKLSVAADPETLVFEQGENGLAAAYRAACQRFFPPSGKLPDPLNFTAPQYSTWIEMQYQPSQEAVLNYARQIRQSGFPPGVLIIDDNWFEAHGDLRFHTGRFPSPRTMIQELHDAGFRLMLWVSPFISPDSGVYRELAARQLLLRTPSGQPSIHRWWNGQSALLDITNPEAAAWLNHQLDSLQEEFGVDGFKLDAGDPELCLATTTPPSVSPLDYCETWAKIGAKYAFNEYRACWKGANLPLIQRLRDKGHCWGREGLADIIPNALAQGLAGYAFNCPDMIGGGEISSFQGSGFQWDQELFVRTAQCCALFPVMQFSAAPWRVLDKEHLSICQTAVRLRQAFGPEILCLAEHAARTGEPILRHLAYVYPDSNLETVNDQFLLGDSILVAPVLEKGTVTRSVVFPPGCWIGEDNVPIDGPTTCEVKAPLDRLPWYRRVTP
jgi:DNA-binding LacI/PurR family transcriptional regulator